jgi:hypothetical protein
LRFLTDGVDFFSVGVREFLVELEIHPQAGDSGSWFASAARAKVAATCFSTNNRYFGGRPAWWMGSAD